MKVSLYGLACLSS